MANSKKNRYFKSLKGKFRMVIMNDETLEEKASFNLRPLNVFVATGLSIILLITITTFIIAFTGLREYIPGYADLKTQRRVYNLVLKTDSMEKAIKARDAYIENIRDVINGNVSKSDTTRKKGGDANKYDTIHHLPKSPQDAELRKTIESEDQFSLAEGSASIRNSIKSFLFFPPLKGTVTNRFDPITKHYGIDIVSDPNEAIKATLDGTVVIANFTSETGYVIGIQHSNNLFSFYKHNSALLKKAGDFVKAGEVIAIIGNSGELSQGPHLHFELWFNGTPLDPMQFVAF
jgi:murein DD-endopeptidase MepM/ murein hydrolase activator NlpD